ncbi:hypothetical protein KFE25_000275 [Diacronema lutheri]|uniref:Translation initiation factor eIF2B subunit delta n=3 Tax=Diacronema lutheri TaxID=2081491 RepID=A0A8J6C736_DIALT|nr:hypothetical protein KFE25_000275 [Diacronema lutheri]
MELSPVETPVGSVDSAQVDFQKVERDLDAQSRASGEQRTFLKHAHSPPSPSALPGGACSPALRGAGLGARDEGSVGAVPAPMRLPVQARPSDVISGAAGSAGSAGASADAPDAPPAKKALTKAERRELQERQRAAKAATAGAASGGKPAPFGSKQASTGANASASSASEPPPVPKQHDTTDAAKLRKQRLLERTDVQKAVALFAHLPQYEREKSISLPAQHACQIHPVVARLGLQYAEGVIQGANARCVAMLNAFKAVIRDYHTPPAKTLNRDLESRLRPQIQYLVDCRPVGINMGNSITWLKATIAKLPAHMPEAEAKEALCAEIDSFIAERITLASAAISALGASKVANGDVIVTYGCAHVVEEILLSAHSRGVSFRVIVLDARPHWEGRALWRRLVAAHLHVSYAGMHALSYAMRSATKVLMGAHACLSNGAVVSRAGSAIVALCASRENVPVLIACETYKFAERVMLDSICANELGDPDDLVTVRPVRAAAQTGAAAATSGAALAAGGALAESVDGGANVLACLTDWRDVSTLRLLNLTYDVTPCELVTMVISEVGMTPPTSVPVIIREYRQDTISAR